MPLFRFAPLLMTALALLSGAGRAHAGSAPLYAVADLRPALLQDAASVVRCHDVTLTFERPDRYTYTVRRAVTILREAAADEARLVVSYSPLHKLSDLSARVYDAGGRVTRKLSGTDWRDLSATDGGTLVDDSRVRLADVRQGLYPYTVELTYTVTSANPLFLPDWQPQQDWDQSVEAATLRLRHAAQLPIRRHGRNLPAGTARPDTTHGGDLVEHRWVLRNLAALVAEPLAPPLAEQAAAVWCAPTTFNVQGHAGSQATWAELGRWCYDLNVGRDVLPDAVRAQMVALQDSVPDPRRRVRRVYEFLQRTTRYVSIQLGLGGWQTIPALDVARTGYGDCKALTNYAHALLGAAGLPAWWALVRAGETTPDLEAAWVAPHFNHVILCVPLPAQPDTVWLECTSSTQPFNCLGAFTADRYVLLLKPDGGRLVRTPRPTAGTTRRHRHTTLRLDAQGQATATVRTRREGRFGDAYADLLALDPTEQRRALTEDLQLATTFTLVRAQLAAAGANPAGAMVREDLELRLPTVAARAGTHLRLPLNLLSQWATRPPDSTRQAALWLPPAAHYADTVVVQLPPGAQADGLPAPTEVATPFGSYRTRVEAGPGTGTVTYYRTLQTIGGHLPAAQYNAYAAFCQRLAKADRQMLTINLATPAKTE